MLTDNATLFHVGRIARNLLPEAVTRPTSGGEHVRYECGWCMLGEESTKIHSSRFQRRRVQLRAGVGA